MEAGAVACRKEFSDGYFVRLSFAFAASAARAAHSLTLSSHLLAQANSIARIASPEGITMNAGPGSTSRAIPMSSTVPPRIKMPTFRKVR